MSITIRLPFDSPNPIRVTQWAGGQFWGAGNAGPPDHVGVSASSYDFALPTGTPVLGLGDGKVVDSVDVVPDGKGASTDPYGNFVTVKYTVGIVTLYATYAHLMRGTALPVGATVAAGTTVGKVGVTGATTGPHLHIQFGLSADHQPRTSAPGPHKVADASGNADIVAFGDPDGQTPVPKFREDQYTYGASSTLSAQVHARSLSLSGGVFDISDIVGKGKGSFPWNSDDYFSFIAPSTGSLTLNLSGLTSDLDMYTMDGRGNRLNKSQNNGTISEKISQDVVSGQAYLIHIDPLNYGASSYHLSGDFKPSSTPLAPVLSRVSPDEYSADRINHPMRLIGSNFASDDTLIFKPPEGGSIKSDPDKLTFVSGNEIDYKFNDDGDVGGWSVRVHSADRTQHSSFVSFRVTAAAPPEPPNMIDVLDAPTVASATATIPRDIKTLGFYLGRPTASPFSKAEAERITNSGRSLVSIFELGQTFNDPSYFNIPIKQADRCRHGDLISARDRSAARVGYLFRR